MMRFLVSGLAGAAVFVIGYFVLGSLVAALIGAGIGVAVGFLAGSLIPRAGGGVKMDFGEVKVRKPKTEAEKKAAADLENLREALHALVRTNILVRAEAFDPVLVAKTESVIDRLRRLLEEFHVIHPDASLAQKTSEQATASVPNLLTQYAQLTQAERDSRKEELSAALDTALADAESLTSDLDTDLSARFATDAELASEFGTDLGGGTAVTERDGLTPAEKRKMDAQYAAIRGLTAPIAKAERYKKTVKDLVVGSYVRWNNQIWKVTEKHLYTEKKKWEWWELQLFSLMTGQTMFMEWEQDDELEVGVSIRELKWRDLRDDEGEGIDEDDLDQICDDEDDIVLNGTTFEYEDDCDALFFRDGDRSAEPEPVWMIDFEAEDGRTIGVEMWKDDDGEEDYEIWLGKQVDPDSFEVFVLPGG